MRRPGYFGSSRSDDTTDNISPSILKKRTCSVPIQAGCHALSTVVMNSRRLAACSDLNMRSCCRATRPGLQRQKQPGQISSPHIVRSDRRSANLTNPDYQLLELFHSAAILKQRGQCPSWVNRVGSTISEPLPVFPGKRTFSKSSALSQNGATSRLIQRGSTILTD